MSIPISSIVPPVFIDPARQSIDELDDLLKVTTPAELTSFHDPEISANECISVDTSLEDQESSGDGSIPVVPLLEDPGLCVAGSLSTDANVPHTGKRDYQFNERRILEQFSAMKPAKFHRLINMSRTTFNRLAAIVCPMLPPGLSSNGKSYQPVERLLAFLYFCGHDTTSLHGSYAHGMSEGGVWQSVDYVINAMYDNFVPEWLTLPTEEQARREARIFHDHTGFPDQLAWAVADGVHFTLHNCPKAWRAECRNRKNGLSINGLIIAGASYRIYAALTDNGGAKHDMAILSTSQLFRELQLGWRPFPNAILLADKAFTATYPWMATPFPDIVAFHDPIKLMYQYEFIRARNHGEQAYGVVKRRFAILRKGLPFSDIRKCSKIINVLLAIHNFIMEQNDVDEFSFMSDRPDEIDPELADGPLPENDENTHDYGNEQRPIKTNEMICRKYYALRNQRNPYE